MSSRLNRVEAMCEAICDRLGIVPAHHSETGEAIMPASDEGEDGDDG